MGWSRRSNPPNNDPDMEHGDDPLAENMRLNRPRRSTDSTQPLNTDRDATIYNQHTVVDNNFSNRSQTRRQRQMTSPFNTQQLTSWAANPDNGRRMMAIGAAVVIFLLILASMAIANRMGRSATAEQELPTEQVPALGLDNPPASVDNQGLDSPAPAIVVPNTDPAQQPAAPAPTAGFFAVTGTGTEGLFLRQDPTTQAQILGTLPEGTRVEYLGETQNDGVREWHRVRTDQFGEGWAAADFLTPAQ